MVMKGGNIKSPENGHSYPAITPTYWKQPTNPTPYLVPGTSKKFLKNRNSGLVT